MRKKLDIIVLTLVAVCFFSVVALNLLQIRPNYSESEQRWLDEMPELRAEELLSGRFFKDFDTFFADTFYQREKLVVLADRIKQNFGVDADYILLGDDNYTDDDDWELPEDVIDKRPVTEPNTEDATEPVTAPPETTPPETDEETTAAPITVTLSMNTVNIIAGSGVSVYAQASCEEKVTLIWSISDNTVVSMTIRNGDSVDLTGLQNGTAELKVTTPDGNFAVCTVNVTAPASSGDVAHVENADFLPNGLFIYGDAVYSKAGYSPGNSKKYAQTLAYYASLFPNARVHAVVAPLSSMLIDEPAIVEKLPDQKKALDGLAGFCEEEGVYMVDVYGALKEHKNEYLYFKSDHHWTARAAYYAYAAYAESIGLTPTPLEDFGYQTITDSYHGSMYRYTMDERVKSFVDVIEAFLPTKEHTMTVYTKTGGSIKYNNAIYTKNKTYVAFIAGDNPYTVINVPENPQDFNVLVLKDSFGNAFVPYLCEHYGNIIVVDPRYVDFNIYETWKDYPISDIVFANNIQSPNSASWTRMFLAAVGISTEK